MLDSLVRPAPWRPSFPSLGAPSTALGESSANAGKMQRCKVVYREWPNAFAVPAAREQDIPSAIIRTSRTTDDRSECVEQSVIAATDAAR